MRAMLLAAGLGTRLRPLTQRRPKCLMPIMNRPLLSLWHERLARLGVTHAVVNTHHLAGQVRAWLKDQDSALSVVESHEPVILGTGGGLVAARDLLGDQAFLLVNADVLATCHELRIDEVYRLGGAQAVAALAYGVEGIERVDKIVGPGNLFVALAKKRVYGEVDIDSIAGPSEVVVIVDGSTRPD